MMDSSGVLQASALTPSGCISLEDLPPVPAHENVKMSHNVCEFWWESAHNHTLVLTSTWGIEGCVCVEVKEEKHSLCFTHLTAFIAETMQATRSMRLSMAAKTSPATSDTFMALPPLADSHGDKITWCLQMPLVLFLKQKTELGTQNDQSIHRDSNSRDVIRGQSV